MDREEFARRLQLATTQTLDFSRQFVWNNLPEHCRYVAVLGGAGLQPTLTDGETVYPQDVVPVGPLNVAGVVELLWRHGTVPEWINISAHSADDVSTYVELLCCARFTDRERLMYFFEQLDTSPFQVRGPSLPWHWQRGDDRFDLHWGHQGQMGCWCGASPAHPSKSATTEDCVTDREGSTSIVYSSDKP